MTYDSSIPHVSGIYQITNTVNDHFYIGSSIDINKRCHVHFYELRTRRHSNRYLQKAYNCYGKEAFVVTIIEIVEQKERLIECEQHYIDTLSPEYNLCLIAGSTLGRKPTPETRCKQSESAKKRPRRPHTEETRHKLSFSRVGKPPTYGMKGKHHSEATKEKLRATRVDIPATEQQKYGLAFGNPKGSTRDRAIVEKARANTTGRKRSEETKTRMREAWQRRKARQAQPPSLWTDVE